MSYSEYTLERVIDELDLTIREVVLFAPPARLQPPAWLVDILARGRSMALASEKSRCEFIVAPILLGCREAVGPTIHLHSGVVLDVDSERGLRGECDFIFTQTPPMPLLLAPILVVLEAKKQDIELGLGQCAAQVYAARLFNQKHGREIEPLYGCVTTGETWQFFRLQARELLFDANRYYLSDVDAILGILTAILQPPNPVTQSSPAA